MDEVIRGKIGELLDRHRIMTLATLRTDGWPQATTVGYANEGFDIYFICSPQSQKAQNLARDNRVSLTIDHDTPDLLSITGLSMAARAERIGDAATIERILELMPKKYPEYSVWPVTKPKPEETAVFRLIPLVISVLDYSKGFGHTDLVTVRQADHG